MRFSLSILILLLCFAGNAQDTSYCPYAPGEQIRIISKSDLSSEKVVRLTVNYDRHCNVNISRDYLNTEDFTHFGFYSFGPRDEWAINAEFNVSYEDSSTGAYYVIPFESNHSIPLKGDTMHIQCHCEEKGAMDLLWSLKVNNLLSGICRVNKEKVTCSQQVQLGTGTLQLTGSVLVIKAREVVFDNYDFSTVK